MIDITKDIEYIELKKKFDAYYTEHLFPVLRRNDRTRRRYLLYFFILILMALVFYPLIILAILQVPFIEDNNRFGYVIAASGFLLMLLGGPMFFYRRHVKPSIMPLFTNFFGKFDYQYGSVLPDSVLASSDLFRKFNRNLGDDYFSGIYSDVRITVAEEKLNFVTFNKESNHTEKSKVFEGVCILLEMNKNFEGRTVVLKDKGLFNVFNGVKGLQNVKLEDSKFEKYFEVYSDSQIEARYLLTTGFMERMLKLCDLYEGKSLQFSFKDNRLLIAIKTRQNLFEAHSFFRSNLNRKKIDIVFDQFFTIFSIVKILKLNQRIGM